jgi:hypothetical protein
MGLVLGAALALFSIAIVAFPFLKSRLRDSGEVPVTAVGQEALEMESLYEAIRILRLEYELGQVPQQLYREQLQGYRLQAAAALRQRVMDREGDPEWALEQEVLTARAALRGAGGVSLPCPSCGAASTPGGGPCPECGENSGTSEPASS